MIGAIEYDVVISEDGEGVDGGKVEGIFEVVCFWIQSSGSAIIHNNSGPCLPFEVASCAFDLQHADTVRCMDDLTV